VRPGRNRGRPPEHGLARGEPYRLRAGLARAGGIAPGGPCAATEAWSAFHVWHAGSPAARRRRERRASEEPDSRVALRTGRASSARRAWSQGAFAQRVRKGGAATTRRKLNERDLAPAFWNVRGRRCALGGELRLSGASAARARGRERTPSSRHNQGMMRTRGPKVSFGPGRGVSRSPRGDAADRGWTTVGR
jgi:hypothetical protein